jgi:hypothetical protein
MVRLHPQPPQQPRSLNYALLYALSFRTIADTGIVLENAKSSEGGHRLGVNGLAVDNDNAIL